MLYRSLLTHQQVFVSKYFVPVGKYFCTSKQVLVYHYATIYVSSNCYICVLILLHMCPHTTIYLASSYYYICVGIQLKSRGYSGFDPNLLSENTAGSAGMNKAQGARPHQPREYTEAREGSSAGEGGEATSAARETAAAREARQPTAAREAKGGTGGGGGVGGMLGRMLGSNKADETAKKLLGRPDVFGDATCDDSTSPTQVCVFVGVGMGVSVVACVCVCVSECVCVTSWKGGTAVGSDMVSVAGVTVNVAGVTNHLRRTCSS